jgi:transcriptional regulator with XRE-family HTH domain
MDNILRSARVAKGLTQADVAAALGRYQGTISKYERRESRPDVAIAKAYAELLGLSPLQVLYPEDAALAGAPTASDRTQVEAAA